MANQFGCFEFNNNLISRNNETFTVEEFVDYYITTNHSARETCIKFKFSGRILQKIMHHYNLEKPSILSHEINKRTCLEKYGDSTYNNQEKLKQTNLEKYGCENVFQSEVIKKASAITKLEKYGDEHFVNPNKAKQTNLERYGVENPMQLEETQAKAKQTCLEHFGVEYPMQSKEVQAKYNFDKMTEKAFNTKKQNGTTNSSKIQDWFIGELKDIYGEYDVETEYKEERYPYHCDAYIKSLDRFIELNIYFTHGGHPYDCNNYEDQQLLAKWKTKANTSKFFINAIRVWTKEDPAKQECAKKNNLNYIMLYTNKEAEDYIKTIRRNNIC